MRALVIPLIVSLLIVIVDQITKIIIVRFVEPYYVSGYSISVIGDFLRIIHTSNTAIAFSIGRDLSVTAKKILFTILPSIMMVGIIWYYLKVVMSRLQRWALAVMIGGGIGNLTDRIFRPQGVIDFIDVKMYGIFGFERWPTFNVADSTIVVGSITLVIATFFFTNCASLLEDGAKDDAAKPATPESERDRKLPRKNNDSATSTNPERDN